MMNVDSIVIGAGVVGLATATALAQSGRETIILDAADTVGTGVSSRSSEVIHAGLYYQQGSLKHRMCVSGRRRLYQWLGTRGIAHQKLGKLIVATSKAEIGRIEALHQNGLENDVEGLRTLTAQEAMSLEPQLRCDAALLSTETGILDGHAFMLSLQGAFEDGGGTIALRSPVSGVEVLDDGRFKLRIGGVEPSEIVTTRLVNAAGLYAHRIARSIDAYNTSFLPRLSLAKGSYFSCRSQPAFSRLVYPAPFDGGLGVHVTLDLGGQMRFGPDVEWLASNDPDAIDYAVDMRRADEFYVAIRRYWPGMPDDCIAPSYAGVRPKLSAEGEAAQDFRIDGPEMHGLDGLVHLFGIESPGLTGSLAIAEHVLMRLR